MKKLVVVLWLVAMLASAVAVAETADFSYFSIEIPKGFSASDLNDAELRYYQKSDFASDETITIRQLGRSCTMDEILEEFEDTVFLTGYGLETREINGVEVTLLSDDAFDENLAAIIPAQGYFYTIHYESWDEVDRDTWEAMLATIDVPAIEEEADSGLASAYPTLEKGSKGDEVKALQQRLIDLYWLTDSTADGDYGNKTKAAVESFQEAANLPITGIADGKTQAALFADDAPEASLSISCSVAGINNYSKAYWSVSGQEFTLSGSQTKTLNTPWGTYKFYASGDYEKID